MSVISMRNETKLLYLMLPLRCVLFISAFSLCGIVTDKSFAEISHLWSIIASVLNFVTIIVLQLICKHNNITYREMICYEKHKNSISESVLVVIVMLLLGMAGMYLAGWLCYGEFPYLAPMMIAPIQPYLAVLNLFVLPITTAIAEDGLYLGFCVNGFKSKHASILLPALFYALQHCFIPTIFDIQFIIYRFLSFLPLTLWICDRYYKKKSILCIMIGHLVLNIATTVQIVITSFMPEKFNMLM